jgi:quercetin dioxygenase-like cupin family protein
MKIVVAGSSDAWSSPLKRLQWRCRSYTMPFRRILTSHHPTDRDGLHVIIHDDDISPGSVAPGQSRMVVAFSTVGLPVVSAHGLDNSDIENAVNLSQSGIVTPNGVNGRMCELGPGAKFGMHRTDSVDYVTMIQGSVTLVTPSPHGSVRTLVKAGEVVIMRGIMHAWEAGEEGARWFSVVIAAQAVEHEGKVLHAVEL